jgi:hypothetical protein
MLQVSNSMTLASDAMEKGHGLESLKNKGTLVELEITL